MTAHERPVEAGQLRAALADLGEQAGVYDALPGAARRAWRHKIRVRVAAAAVALAVLVAGITAVAWGHGTLLSLPQPANRVSPTPTDLEAPGGVVTLPSTPPATPLTAGMKVGAGVLVTDRYLLTTANRWYALPSGGGSTVIPVGLSPDGHQLVYALAARQVGEQPAAPDRLVVQDLTTGRVHSARMTVRGAAAWSENSRWLLVFTPDVTPERPAAHREAVRLDLRTGATTTFDLAALGQSVVDDGAVPVAGAVRDDGRLLLARAGAAPAFPGGAGSTAAGDVTVRTVDPSTGATEGTTTLPGALPWRLNTVSAPGYTGPNPRPAPNGRLLLWLVGDGRQVVVQVGPLLPSSSVNYADDGWTPTATELYDLGSGRHLADVPGLAVPDSETRVTVAAGGHDLTVVFDVAGRELTVCRLDPATGRKRTTARYVSPSLLVRLPGQTAPLDQQ